MNPSDNKEPEKEDKYGNLVNYAQGNPRDVVAYIMLLLGIILLFFQPLVGGLLIGLVAGVYFSKEMIALIKNFDEWVDRQGLGRSLVLGGIALAFFISAPAIFIGAAIILLVRWFAFPDAEV